MGRWVAALFLFLYTIVALQAGAGVLFAFTDFFNLGAWIHETRSAEPGNLTWLGPVGEGGAAMRTMPAFVAFMVIGSYFGSIAFFFVVRANRIHVDEKNGDRPGCPGLIRGNRPPAFGLNSGGFRSSSRNRVGAITPVPALPPLDNQQGGYTPDQHDRRAGQQARNRLLGRGQDIRDVAGGYKGNRIEKGMQGDNGPDRSRYVTHGEQDQANGRRKNRLSKNDAVGCIGNETQQMGAAEQSRGDEGCRPEAGFFHRTVDQTAKNALLADPDEQRHQNPANHHH